jgi:hypothetical protein
MEHEYRAYGENDVTIKSGVVIADDNIYEVMEAIVQDVGEEKYENEVCGVEVK